MNSGAHMAQVLGATGIYKLTGESPADWELAGFAAGFQVIEEAMAGVESELFALTAPAERLREWEKFFRFQASAGELEMRRKGVAKALGLRCERASLRAIQETVLPIAGVEGTVAEADGKLVITGSLRGVTEKEAKRLLDRHLPAHMEWELTLI